MKLERTPHGLSLVRFTDCAGQPCSLQDSSLASETCCWFGVSRLPGFRRRDATRMHVTVEMVRQIARRLSAAIEGRAIDELRFEDRYGSECLLTSPQASKAIVSVGVVRAMGRNQGRLMHLDRQAVVALMPMLLGILAKGTISGTGGACELEEPAARILDVKIPTSMLGRADLAETGVAAQDVVDGFLRLFAHYGDDVEDALGRDERDRLTALADRIGHLATPRR